MSSQTEEQSNEGIVNSVIPREHREQLLSCLRVKPVVRVGPADFRLLRRPEITVSPVFAIVLIELNFSRPASGLLLEKDSADRVEFFQACLGSIT